MPAADTNIRISKKTLRELGRVATFQQRTKKATLERLVSSAVAAIAKPVDISTPAPLTTASVSQG